MYITGIFREQQRLIGRLVVFAKVVGKYWKQQTAPYGRILQYTEYLPSK